MQTPTRPAHAGYPEQRPALPGVSISSTVEGLTLALQAHLAPEAWQPRFATETADEAAAALQGLLSALAGEMPHALGQARERLQRNLDVSLVLQAQAQLAAMSAHDEAIAPAAISLLQAAGQQAAQARRAAQALLTELEHADRLIGLLLREMPPAALVRFAHASDQAGATSNGLARIRYYERAVAMGTARNCGLDLQAASHG